MKNKLFLLLLIVINFSSTFSMMAQDEGPEPPEPVVGIDTNLYILIGAAMLLAWYVYSRRNLRKNA